MTLDFKHTLFFLKNLLKSPVVTPGTMVTVMSSTLLEGCKEKLKNLLSLFPKRLCTQGLAKLPSSSSPLNSIRYSLSQSILNLPFSLRFSMIPVSGLCGLLMEGMGDRRQFARVTWGSVRAHPIWAVLEIVHDWHKITSGGRKGHVTKKNAVFECRSNAECRRRKLVLECKISGETFK